MDTCLLRSTPKLFTSLADALEWVFSSKGMQWSIHYIDDFLTAGRPGTDECSRYLDCIKFTCTDLGVPLKLTKIVGPSPVIEFLGITLDTVRMELRLPEDKIQRLLGEITKWSGKLYCRKRELLSLIGLLLTLARSFGLVAYSFVVSLTIP